MKYAMLLYTHLWDLLLKCTTALTFTLIPLIVHEHVFGINADIVMPVILVGALVTVVLYRQLVSILSCWLYARINLGVPVSFSDAKALRLLFQLTVGDEPRVGWFPMKAVKQLPRTERRAELMTELRRVQAGHRHMII
jgi:hypothetical protein